MECSVKNCSVQCVICDCSIDKPNIICDIPKLNTFRTDFRIEYLTNKPEELQYYTGFENYKHILLVFNLLGDQVNNLKYYPKIEPAVQTRILSPENDFFFTSKVT